MEKNVGYEMTISEILFLIKQHWKIMGIVVLVCILLCGGYKAMTSESGQVQVQLDADYEKNMEVFKQFQNAQKDIPFSLKTEWERVYHDRNYNPVFSVNPYDCEYEQIVLRFGDKDRDHDWTVSNWVAEADNQILFGSQSDTLSDYKNTIIMTGQMIAGHNLSEESVVKVLSIEDFDAKAASNYLIKHFRKKAAEENLTIEGISTASIKGYNEDVNNYQKRNKDELNSVYATLEATSGLERHIIDPGITQTNQPNVLAGIIKYCLMGLIVGFVLGAVLLVLNAIRKREIISTRQVENAFKLELLGDCSSAEDDAALDVLNANLNIMTGERSNIMVIADNGIDDLEEISSEWAKNSNHTFIVCNDIFNDPDMIEALQSADGIIIGIKLGLSKLEQIQKIVLRAAKLDQKVLGYVLL